MNNLHDRVIKKQHGLTLIQTYRELSARTTQRSNLLLMLGVFIRAHNGKGFNTFCNLFSSVWCLMNRTRVSYNPLLATSRTDQNELLKQCKCSTLPLNQQLHFEILRYSQTPRAEQRQSALHSTATHISSFHNMHQSRNVIIIDLNK